MSNDNNNLTTHTTLVSDLRQIIDQGRRQAYISINASMIQTYWHVGRRIVEEEQQGKERADYGEQIARKVAKELQADYGSAFNYRNICYFRQFYLCFRDSTIVNARVHNLSWTHIRLLLRVDDPKARLWYLNEASSQMWSTRELERNILSQYYYRLLSNQKDSTSQVADIHAGEAAIPEKGEFIKKRLPHVRHQ